MKTHKNMNGRVDKRNVVLWLVIVNVITSALHYAHNATYFDEYPNEPVWLSPWRIDVLWFLVTPIGLAGYWLYRRGRYQSALVLLVLYGVLGLGGLGHYALAPMSAHSFTMNLTILLESASAAILLVALAALATTRDKVGAIRTTAE